jgi:hypothetical protein
MAALSSLKRLARLSGWLWLSLLAMLIAACGALFASACKQSTAGKDAGPDARDTGANDASTIVLPNPDAAPAGEAAAPTDAGEDELWNVPCE